MKITRETINQGMSEAGGWNRKQTELLGLPWPLPHGWIREIVGKDFSEETVNQFLALKGYRKKRKPKFAAPDSRALPDTAKTVEIFTDGACEVKFTGGPRKGAYAFLIHHHDGIKESMAQAFANTTNNRMEVMAAIAGINQILEPAKITLYSDSQYLVHAFKLGWVYKWERNRWRVGDKGEKRKNWDLFEMLLRLTRKHQVEFKWVRGHNGHQENEQCDKLAEAMLKCGPFVDDIMYERLIREEKETRGTQQEVNSYYYR